MEVYFWMLLAAIALGFLAKTYWDVYLAWRAYERSAAQTKASEIIAPPVSVARFSARRGFVWLLAKADRALHAMLMSPTAR